MTDLPTATPDEQRAFEAAVASVQRRTAWGRAEACDAVLDAMWKHRGAWQQAVEDMGREKVTA